MYKYTYTGTYMLCCVDMRLPRTYIQHLLMYIYTHTYVHTHVLTHVHIHICMHLFRYIHVYIVHNPHVFCKKNTGHTSLGARIHNCGELMVSTINRFPLFSEKNGGWLIVNATNSPLPLWSLESLK